MNKTLAELHKIREEIYEEEKNLSPKEVIEKIHEESEKFMKENNLKLRRLHKRAVGV